ncbi:unnamed protein product [Brachionus calyciflorus]|uniref:Uncharacterized protein n=1 Tax=Brachionus calyciflorus TaxID=104777 RepID=A0A813VAQ6_9BILA|nr:unnamed protein product [Brachionus calyciflorus]
MIYFYLILININFAFSLKWGCTSTCLSLKYICFKGNNDTFNQNLLKKCYDDTKTTLRSLRLDFFKFNNSEIYDFNFLKANSYGFSIHDSYFDDILVNISGVKLSNITFLRTTLKKLTRSDLLPSTTKFLNLQYNQIEYIDSKFFTKFTKLHSVSLQINKIKKINALTFNSDSFKKINFSHNLLEQLDEIRFLEKPNEPELAILLNDNYLNKMPLIKGKIESIYRFVLGYQQKSKILSSQYNMLLNDEQDKKLAIEHFYVDFDMFSTNITNEFKCFVNSNRIRIETYSFFSIDVQSPLFKNIIIHTKGVQNESSIKNYIDLCKQDSILTLKLTKNYFAAMSKISLSDTFWHNTCNKYLDPKEFKNFPITTKNTATNIIKDFNNQNFTPEIRIYLKRKDSLMNDFIDFSIDNQGEVVLIFTSFFLVILLAFCLANQAVIKNKVIKK